MQASVRRIAVVLGTRPEIIKLAPLIKELGNEAYVVHTGQHYDAELSGQLFEQLGLDAPQVTLRNIGGKHRWSQISTGIEALAEEFLVSRPDVVVVQGGTNSAAAGAQAASYVGIPLIHLEAGMRSDDRGMPEEINRIMIGALADVHCTATAQNARRLHDEGVPAEKVIVTGNTVIETTRPSLSQPTTLPIELPDDGFVLATIHRPENTDTEAALRRVLIELNEIPLPVIFVAHPRTRAAIDRFGLEDLTSEMTVTQSLTHAQFLQIAQRATIIVSDSGTVQEEVTVLKKPLIVPRRSTARPEAILAGFSRLVPPRASISLEADRLLRDPNVAARLGASVSPFGDGTAGRRIAAQCRKLADVSRVPVAA